MAKWHDELNDKERKQLARARSKNNKTAEELRDLTALLKNRCEQRMRVKARSQTDKSLNK